MTQAAETNFIMVNFIKIPHPMTIQLILSSTINVPVICNKLHALNLIDDTYNSMEFEMLRMQYQKALNHLVTVAQAQNGSESALQGPR